MCRSSIKVLNLINLHRVMTGKTALQFNTKHKLLQAKIVMTAQIVQLGPNVCTNDNQTLIFADKQCATEGDQSQ